MPGPSCQLFKCHGSILVESVNLLKLSFCSPLPGSLDESDGSVVRHVHLLSNFAVGQILRLFESQRLILTLSRSGEVLLSWFCVSSSDSTHGDAKLLGHLPGSLLFSGSHAPSLAKSPNTRTPRAHAEEVTWY